MLEAHAHLHAMVPGGGPSLTGDRRWIKSRRPNVKQCDGNYLCDAEELKSKFRDNFLAGLRRLHAAANLNLNGDWEFLQDKATFDDWLKPTGIHHMGRVHRTAAVRKLSAGADGQSIWLGI